MAYIFPVVTRSWVIQLRIGLLLSRLQKKQVMFSDGPKDYVMVVDILTAILRYRAVTGGLCHGRVLSSHILLLLTTPDSSFVGGARDESYNY